MRYIPDELGAGLVVELDFLALKFASVHFSPELTFICIFVTGAVFEQGTTQTQTAFKYALAVRNGPEEQRRNGDVEFQAFVNVINTADAFKLSRISKYQLVYCLLRIDFIRFSYFQPRIYLFHNKYNGCNIFF